MRAFQKRWKVKELCNAKYFEVPDFCFSFDSSHGNVQNIVSDPVSNSAFFCVLCCIVCFVLCFICNFVSYSYLCFTPVVADSTDMIISFVIDFLKFSYSKRIDTTATALLLLAMKVFSATIVNFFDKNYCMKN